MGTASAKPALPNRHCLNDCRGLGSVTLPSGVQGQSPCMNCAFSQSTFSQKMCATRTKPPQRGDLGRAAARHARLSHQHGMDRKTAGRIFSLSSRQGTAKPSQPKRLQGSGERHAPQRGAGAEPLHELRVFPKHIFAENVRNAHKTAPKGRPWEGGSPTRTVISSTRHGQENSRSDIQSIIPAWPENGFGSKPSSRHGQKTALVPNHHPGMARKRLWFQTISCLANVWSGCRPPGVPLRGVLGALRPFAAQMGFCESAPVTCRGFAPAPHWGP